MTKLTNKEVRLESYYIWTCPKCKNNIEGFDSDLNQIGCIPDGTRIYSFYCPCCKKFLNVPDFSLGLLTKGEW